MLPPGTAWTQTEEDVEVRVTLPGNRKKSDVRVRVTTSALSVAAREFAAGASGWTSVLDGALCRRVDCESCCWTLESALPEAVGINSGVHDRDTNLRRPSSPTTVLVIQVRERERRRASGFRSRLRG